MFKQDGDAQKKGKKEVKSHAGTFISRKFESKTHIDEPADEKGQGRRRP
jgi:hypothetical protein